MAKPSECAGCKKPATIHLTQIVNSEVKKLDFCESCPLQKGITEPEGFSLAQLLTNPGPLAGSSDSSPSCSACGFRPEDFKKTHRLGCSECYGELDAFVRPMVLSMQGGKQHFGKVPQDVLNRDQRRNLLQQLESELQSAVREERYEDAARLRDRIGSIKLN